ncbi:MAG TPA: ChaN family lipoprotein [Rubrivivax sp.]|nr:ChaN family lipoprotein [Rubrivivax sp.]
MNMIARLAAAVLGLAAASAGAAELLIFGEMHDQPDQQRQVAGEVQRLAAAGRLAAVVLEMAERPQRSSGLARDATEAQVQQALAWRGWNWEPYAAVVMNAVRAGVPVVGGNLPRSELRAAMADASLETKLPPEVLERMTQAVREGHCGLLPEAQLPGMVRVQIARDLSLAATVSQLAREAGAQQTVLLLTGAQHASRDRGVPRHLAQLDPDLPVHVVMFGEASAALSADEHRNAQRTPQADQCEALRRSLGASAPR